MVPSTLTDLPESAGPSQLEIELDWIANRTPEEIEQARQRINAASRPPRAIPDGKTLSDMVCGQWPGEETDGEIDAALERLS